MLYLSVVSLKISEMYIAVACIVARRTLIELQIEHIESLDDMFSYLRLLPLESLPFRVVYKQVYVQWQSLAGLFFPCNKQTWLLAYMCILHEPVIKVVAKGVDIQLAWNDGRLLETLIRIEMRSQVTCLFV